MNSDYFVVNPSKAPVRERGANVGREHDAIVSSLDAAMDQLGEVERQYLIDSEFSLERATSVIRLLASIGHSSCRSSAAMKVAEFLAEHGLFGSIILLYILFNLIFSKIKIVLVSKNLLQLGCLIFLITSFIPILPTGAFFADYNLTIFWINLSIMYAVGEKTNVYKNN